MAGPPWTFGFIGSSALFNTEALVFFCREVWPLIRAQLPAARLLVAGQAGTTCAALPPALRNGIDVIGRVEDLATFYGRVRIVLVPLLSGTGVSVKTMEAAIHGAAIVSTKAGLRGLALRHGVEVVLAETASGFAAAAVALANDPARAARRGAAARTAVASRHSPALFREGLRALLPPARAAA